MLRKLIEASGHDLDLVLHPRADRPRGLPDTPRGRSLRRHRKALLEMAARSDATNIRVFGSVARGDDTPTSDIDLLVDLGPRVGLLSLIGLEMEMEELLGVDVDLIPSSGLKPGLRDRVLAEAIFL
jgi:predicted nucleotidyltransferase